MGRKKKVKAPLNPRDFEGQPDEYVLSQVMEDIDRADKFISDKLDKFAKYYEMYSGIIDEKDKREYGANLFIPYVYSQIETSIPKMLSSVLESKPYISYKAVGGGDMKKAQNITQLVGFQLEKKMKITTELYDVFKCAISYGTAITKQSWKYQTKKSIKRAYTDQEVVLEDGSTQVTQKLGPVEYEKVIYDAPCMKNIPIEDFFFDPAQTDIPSCAFCGIKYHKELHELKEGEENGIYRNTANISSDSEEQDVKVLPAEKAKAGMHNGVLIHEYWTDDWKVMIADKTTVIQCIPNPYYHKKKPFVKWVAIHMPNEFYGKSMIETLVDLQIELNTLRSQRIDNITMALNRMWLINKNADIDTNQLRSRPNGFVEVDNIQEDIKELIMSDVTSSAYQDEEIVKADMDTTSGVHSYDRGSNPDKQDTATVANLLSSASSERFRLMVMMLSNDPLSEVGIQLAELNQQFLTEETFTKVLDIDETEEVTAAGAPISEEMTLTFDDIDVDFDIVATSTALEPSVNKEMRQSQLIQLLNVASDMPEVNKVELMREIFRAFEFKNIDDMVQIAPPQPEITEGDQMQESDPNGLYPQIGGVGSLATHLQKPIA